MGCGAPGVNLQRASAMVCDMGDPCLHPSPIKVVVALNKMLKPDKWQAGFDSNGKVCGFHKALKLIVLGGVDPSIRPEVWEFLLGCYTLSSTKEYRKLLREARRERYEELVKQCKSMHSSIGTGSLAYVVGSKIMDVRTYSKDDGKREADSEEIQASGDNTNKLDDYCDNSNKNCTDTTHTSRRESSSDSSDIVSVRESIDSAAYDSSCLMPSPSKFACSSLKSRMQPRESGYPPVDFFDFPPLPVTNLFEKSDEGEDDGDHSHNDGHSTTWNTQSPEERMHSFQIGDNEELIVESNDSLSDSLRPSISSEIEMSDGQSDEAQEQVLRRDIQKYKNNVLSRLRISDVPEASELYTCNGPGGVPSEDKVSDWLWTLHRIVVDVVRTDSHLEFYEDSKNLARMSDILAVYAWVDPETGYCQGMSDLLSPFVVLFDNDADAFWCFEMLLRRTRENFRMEGETGVMKQLQTLWRILKLTDREMFSHLTQIGAESLHFAFRMLLVLFRRELSFTEALCMWEMMWAADFEESLAWNLAESCLEPLVLQLPDEVGTDTGDEMKETIERSSKSGSQSKHNTKETIEGSSKDSSQTKHNTKETVEGNSKGGSQAKHNTKETIESSSKSSSQAKPNTKEIIESSSKSSSQAKPNTKETIEGSSKSSSQAKDNTKETVESSSKSGSQAKHNMKETVEGSSKSGSQAKHSMKEIVEGSSKSGPLAKHSMKVIVQGSSKSGPISKYHNDERMLSPDEAVMKALTSNHSFCGLTKSLWSRSERMHERPEFTISRNKGDELPVFCVAAILILNRTKIIKETHSLDDLIKVFNDNMLKIKVRRCIRTAVKLRKKYFYKLIKPNNPPLHDDA